MDRVDRLYFVRSTKIDLREETRINATAQESADWEKEHASDAGMPTVSRIYATFAEGGA